MLKVVSEGKGESNRSANGWGVQNRLLSLMEDRDDASLSQHNTHTEARKCGDEVGVNHPDICYKFDLVRSRAPDRFLTYFGNNFISQMVEEAIRGTSTLDLILTKKKKIVGEMKIDRNIQRELLCHLGVIKEGKADFKKFKAKRHDSMV
jgi:hypothetical protein